LVGVDLNESSLEDAIVLMKGWTNLAGLPINMMPKTLLVPQGLAFAASRMLKSAYRVNTPNNDVNAIVEDKYIPGGYMVCNYLTDPTNWFLLTDEPNGLKFFMRSPVELDFIEDTFTQTVTSVAYERYAFGTSTWMAAVIGQGI
jgi:hypothetical protein